MTPYLLDTWVFLAVMDDISVLSPSVQGVFGDKEAVFYVSSASFFEIAVKKALKKVKIPDNIADMTRAAGFQILPIQPEHALRTVRLPNQQTKDEPEPVDLLITRDLYDEGICNAP